MKDDFQYIDVEGADLSAIEKKAELKKVKAPVKKGAVIGKVVYSLNGEAIGEVNITAKESVEKTTFFTALLDVLEHLMV